MKYLVAVCILISAGFAQAEDFGLGIILGDPTGLSGKMKWDQAHSIDAALAYSTGRSSGMQFHMDYLWDRARTWETTEAPIHLYYGLGGRLVSYKKDDKAEVSVGPRGSLGLSWNLDNPNLEFFGEVAAILDLTPSMGVDIDAGIGARIRF